MALILGAYSQWYPEPTNKLSRAIFSKTDIYETASWFGDGHAEALGRPRYVYVDVSVGNCQNIMHRLLTHISLYGNTIAFIVINLLYLIVSLAEL